MIELSNVKLTSNGIGPGTTVKVGDVVVEGLVSVTFAVSAGEVGLLTLVVEGATVDAELPFIPTEIRLAVDNLDEEAAAAQ